MGIMRVKKGRPASERDGFNTPKTAQQTIPIRRIYRDGTWELTGGQFSRTWRFSDINYAVAGKAAQEALLVEWCNVLNSQPAGINTKITLVNHRLNRTAFQRDIFMPGKEDGMDVYRDEYNQMLVDKAEAGNGIVQEKYITVASSHKNVEEAHSFFTRVGGNLIAGVNKLGSVARCLDNAERLRIIHDFFRIGEEDRFSFDLTDLMKKGEDFRNSICPQSIQFKGSYFEMGDGKYGRVLFLEKYASYLKDTMIAELADLPKNMMISIDFCPEATDNAMRDLQKIDMAVESDLARWQRRQNEHNNFSAEPPYELKMMREVVKDYLDDITQKDQRLMMATVTLVHVADSIAELNADTDTLLSVGTKNGCDFATLTYQQEVGLNTVLPYGLRKIEAKRTLTTASTAVLMPFSSQEIADEEGIYYGVNAVSKNLILCNRKLLINGNGFIVGVSGSGKSMAGKGELATVALSTEDDILVVDPDREYAPLVQALGGAVIRISAGSVHHINAMDMSKDYADGENPIILKSEFVLSLCEQLMGTGNLGAREKSIIDRCVALVYRDYVINFDGQPPTLQDLHATLLEQPEPEARSVALAMELFTKGSLNAFAHQTNVDMSSRIVCYDIHDLGKQLKTVGMLVMLDAINNRITRNRQQGKRTWILIDEIKVLFDNEYSSAFLERSWLNYRKYGGLATGLIQNAEKCLQSETARTMFGNSEFMLILRQAPADLAKLVPLLAISETQESYVRNAEAGHGLIKVGDAIVPFENNFPHDTKLYALMTTKPGEG